VVVICVFFVFLIVTVELNECVRPIKLYDKHFQSPDFPLSVDMLLNVLEVIAPFKHFSKLREFVLMKLPPGFPVKIGEQLAVIIYFEFNLFTYVDCEVAG
jgi:hypothetical protein